MQVAQDENLVARFRDGDPTTIEDLLSLVFRWIRKQYPDLSFDNAEDLAHSTIVRAYERLDSYAGRSLFKTWLLGVATNVVREHARKGSCVFTRGPVDALDEAMIDCEETDPEEIAIRSMYVQDAKAMLTNQERQVVEMRVEKALDAQRVAAILGITPNAVYCTLKRALDKMRSKLKDIE